MVGAIFVGGGPAALGDTVSIFHEPSRPAVPGRRRGEGFPGCVIDPEKTSPLNLERQGRVHEVIGTSPAFRR